MVIDKWTRSQNNKNLSIPLLGHKTKDNFSELKKEYERLQSLNHKFKKKSNDSQQDFNNRQEISELDPNDIKEYINQINSILLSINELLSENLNYEREHYNSSASKEINFIADKIFSEYNSFLNNIKELENKGSKFDNKFDYNLLSYKCEKIIKSINKKIKKDESEENFIVVKPEIKNYNFNRNIDRGHINIITHRREFNNSITIFKNNFQYSIENEGLTDSTKLILYFMIVLFALFICYKCIA